MLGLCFMESRATNADVGAFFSLLSNALSIWPRLGFRVTYAVRKRFDAVAAGKISSGGHGDKRTGNGEGEEGRK